MNHPYYINEQGYIDDAGFREPTFDVELARTTTTKKPVVAFPTAKDLPENIEIEKEDHASDTAIEGQLTIDVYQTDKEIIIRSPIAGVMSADDIDIAIGPDSVTIKGERRPSEKIDPDSFLYQECYWGRFSRSVILPQEIDVEAAVANFSKNGILTIRLPKLKRDKARKLSVRFS